MIDDMETLDQSEINCIKYLLEKRTSENNIILNTLLRHSET
jgi:hypothetical protein